MREGIVLSGVIQTVRNCLRSNTVEQNGDEIQSNYNLKINLTKLKDLVTKFDSAMYIFQGKEAIWG